MNFDVDRQSQSKIKELRDLKLKVAQVDRSLLKNIKQILNVTQSSNSNH